MTAVPAGRGRLRVPPGAVLPAALAVLAGLVAAVLAGVLVQTDGHFAYTLDDPYIHLTLARQIAHGHYGINPGEAAAPSSSVLWPFLLVPVAWSAAGLYAPLVVNVVCAGLTLVVLHGLLRRAFGGAGGDGVPGLRLLLLLLAVPTLHLIGLAFTGMEHSLQMLLTVAAVAGLVEGASGRRVPRWALVALALGPFVRYENLAVTLPAAAYLFALGERRAAVAVVGVVAVGLGAFTVGLLALGLGPLPSSVLVKQALVARGLPGVVDRLEDAMTNRTGVLLLAGALILAGAALAPGRRHAERGLAAIAVAAVGLHSLAGAFGYRYEAYLIAVVVLTLLVLYREPVLARWAAWPRATAALVVAVVAVLAAPFVAVSAVTPLAARNVYEQQGQMARFVSEVWRRPVAVNDLGLVGYRSPAYVLDVAGLASLDAIRGRREDPSGAWMDPLARAHGVDLAMIYAHWFPRVPAGWVRLGTLRIGTPNVTLGGSDVAFYATRAAARPGLAAALDRFRRTLPPGVTFEAAPRR